MLEIIKDLPLPLLINIAYFVLALIINAVGLGISTIFFVIENFLK